MFFHPYAEILEEILRTLQQIEHTGKQQLYLLWEIRNELRPPQRLTQGIKIRFTGDQSMADNVLVLTVGQSSTATIVPLLADGTTHSGGTLSNVVWTFSDASATLTANPDNTATIKGVAQSTGAIIGSAACTVTDTDGAVSTWNQSFTVTTNAVVPPPAQLTQSIAVQFSTPA